MALPAIGYADAAEAGADGMIHYWPMDDEAGTTVTDLVGALDGTVQNDPNDDTIGPGKFGLARHLPGGFGGVGISLLEQVYVPDTPPDYEQWTIGGWLRAPAAQSGGRLVVTLQYYSSASDFYRLYVSIGDDGALGVSYGLNYSEGLFMASSPGAVDVDTDHLVVVSCDGAGVRVDLDGAVLLSGEGATPLSFASGLASLGMYDDGSLVFHGMLDDWGMWSRPLTPEESARWWNEGGGLPLIQTGAAVEIGLDAALAGVGGALRLWTDWTAHLVAPDKTVVYTARLTAPGLPPLELAISSWQATAQSSERQSYLSVVVRGASAIIDAIEARADGELYVYQGWRLPDGVTHYEPLLSVPLGEIRIDQGAGRGTATLSGYGVADLGTGQVRDLVGVRSLSRQNGVRRVRASIDLFLRAGDVARLGDEEIPVAWINYYAGAEGAFMDIGEARQ